MIALLAMLQAAMVAPDADITVIGQRLKGISAIVGKDAQGRFTCSLTGSSGDVRLDGRLCRTASKCVAKGATSRETVSACIDKRKPQLLEQLRKEREKGA